MEKLLLFFFLLGSTLLFKGCMSIDVNFLSDPVQENTLAQSYEHAGNCQKALKYYKRSADHGFIEAKYNLARLYYFKDLPCSSVNEESAVRLALEPAARGMPQAQYLLGNAYYYGHGVPQDKKRGIVWMQLASDGGNTAAKVFLANLQKKRLTSKTKKKVSRAKIKTAVSLDNLQKKTVRKQTKKKASRTEITSKVPTPDRSESTLKESAPALSDESDFL